MAEFLPDDTAKRGLQRLLNPANMLPKSIIDQALMVSPAGQAYLLPKPVDKIVIEPDRDSGLALGHLHDGSAFCVAEVVFTFHCFWLCPVALGFCRTRRKRYPLVAPKGRIRFAEFRERLIVSKYTSIMF